MTVQSVDLLNINKRRLLPLTNGSLIITVNCLDRYLIPVICESIRTIMHYAAHVVRQSHVFNLLGSPSLKVSVGSSDNVLFAENGNGKIWPSLRT